MRGVLRLVGGCLRLYRLDVAAISLLGFQAGVVLSGHVPSLRTLLYGLIVSGLAMNYVYALNAWADRAIDAINKPTRPLAAGDLSERVAWRYCQGLLACSLVAPLAFRRPLPIVLSWLLVFLGWGYSRPPLHFKRKKLPALVVTAVAHHIAPLAGYYWLAPPKAAPPWVLAFTLLIALAIVPLKDLRDRAGDDRFAIENWATALGARALLLRSLALLFATALLIVLVAPPRAVQVSLFAVLGAISTMIAWTVQRPRFAERVYERILGVIALGFFLFVALSRAQGSG